MGYLKCTGMKTQDTGVLLILRVLDVYGLAECVSVMESLLLCTGN